MMIIMSTPPAHPADADAGGGSRVVWSCDDDHDRGLEAYDIATLCASSNHQQAVIDEFFFLCCFYLYPKERGLVCR